MLPSEQRGWEPSMDAQEGEDGGAEYSDDDVPESNGALATGPAGAAAVGGDAGAPRAPGVVGGGAPRGDVRQVDPAGILKDLIWMVSRGVSANVCAYACARAFVRVSVRVRVCALMGWCAAG